MFSSAKLVRVRESRGFSRSDVHRALVRQGMDCCRSLIDRWESGRSEPSASEAELLARTLGVPLTELFERVDVCGAE